MTGLTPISQHNFGSNIVIVKVQTLCLSLMVMHAAGRRMDPEQSRVGTRAGAHDPKKVSLHALYILTWNGFLFFVSSRSGAWTVKFFIGAIQNAGN